MRSAPDTHPASNVGQVCSAHTPTSKRGPQASLLLRGEIHPGANPPHQGNPSFLSAVKSFSCVRLFATPWTVAHQALLSMGILQARTLEWVAMPFSRGSSQPRDQTHVSHIAGGLFTI